MEIDSHRDIYSSLNETGHKILQSLERHDDAMVLQRKLDEMNQRWNTLKAKSIAIRYSYLVGFFTISDLIMLMIIVVSCIKESFGE